MTGWGVGRISWGATTPPLTCGWTEDWSGFPDGPLPTVGTFVMGVDTTLDPNNWAELLIGSGLLGVPSVAAGNLVSPTPGNATTFGTARGVPVCVAATLFLAGASIVATGTALLGMAFVTQGTGDPGLWVQRFDTTFLGYSIAPSPVSGTTAMDFSLLYDSTTMTGSIFVGGILRRQQVLASNPGLPVAMILYVREAAAIRTVSFMAG